jgi:5-methylcytosine-specific restriction enzyme subunit McrC
VTLTELRNGLRIETRSFVGQLAIGPLDLTIVPKVGWGRWLGLFGYALALRDVVRSTATDARVGLSSLHDLIVLELILEARDIVRHGVHRDYERQRAALAVPRGRMDFARIARGGLTSVRIPSRFTRRVDDTLLNRALLAALRLGARIATDLRLRSEAGQLARQLETVALPEALSGQLLQRARRSVDRRTLRYLPAFRLAELLLDGMAITVVENDIDRTVSIPGFALDMNRLWQRLLGRVLTEWVPGVQVHEERVLSRVIQSDREYPLRKHRSVPRPRPDFAVAKGSCKESFLDAKYRDLWNKPLPREMLYQLALYAMAQRGGVAAMLYPTEAAGAVEERLSICSPFDGSTNAAVALRPVDLGRLEKLVVAAPSSTRAKERDTFARALLGMS